MFLQGRKYLTSRANRVKHNNDGTHILPACTLCTVSRPANTAPPNPTRLPCWKNIAETTGLRLRGPSFSLAQRGPICASESSTRREGGGCTVRRLFEICRKIPQISSDDVCQEMPYAVKRKNQRGISAIAVPPTIQNETKTKVFGVLQPEHGAQGNSKRHKMLLERKHQTGEFVLHAK